MKMCSYGTNGCSLQFFEKNRTLLYLHINEINGLKKLLVNFYAWLVHVVCVVRCLTYGSRKALRSFSFLPSFPNRNPENAGLQEVTEN
jgi:hypothetical protein